MNRVAISGNLTRDAELRQTQGGMAVANFGVAVNDRRKNQATGEWEDFPNYVDCTLFGRRAESLAPILTKGKKVALEGKLRWSEWEAKDGTKRSKLSVVVEEIELMSARDGGRQEGGWNEGKVVGKGAYQPALNAQPGPQDDGIPF